MKLDEHSTGKKEASFHLDKWFLDFTGANGEAMIFYASRLTWYGITVSYTSKLSYFPGTGVRVRSRFRNIHMPQKTDDLIHWGDAKFGVSGTWRSMANAIQQRIFDSVEGYLDWRCHQPASKVTLKLNNNIIEGQGYAEQLILTVPPWKIPMDELRWGRFVSQENNMVWIELREKEKRQWLWLNGERIDECVIEDDFIAMPGKDMTLKLDRGTVLEAEKKIMSVVEKIIRYIPGFNKAMPISFLMADEFKWLSRGELMADSSSLPGGMAIHELVNFKPSGT